MSRGTERRFKTMKHSKENIIRLLKKERETLSFLFHYYRKQNKSEQVSNYARELNSLDHFLNLLEDKDYFNRMSKIYNLEENQ